VIFSAFQRGEKMKKFFFVISIIAAMTLSTDALAGSLIAAGIINAPDNSVKIKGILYFAADDKIHGVELWKNDGTRAGTVMVKDINPNGSSYPVCLTDVNGILFFQANDGTHGTQLWKSNGYEAGTEMVKLINPGGGSYPVCLTDVKGTLFFQANDGVHGAELWKSDGYEAGTVMVKDINPNGGSYPSALTNVNSTLFFQADDGTHGVRLWTSDGYEDGTVMVKDINSPAAPPAPSNPAPGTYITNMTKNENNPFYTDLAPAQDQLNLTSDQSQYQNSLLSLNDDQVDLHDCLLMASDWISCGITYLE
jgi:ELWxxDGT repeat protein